MAEELRLHEVLGNGAAVDDDERPLGAVGTAMELSGEQLLARTGFARDQNVDVGRRNLLNSPKDLLQARTTPDDVAKSLRLELLGDAITVGRELV